MLRMFAAHKPSWNPHEYWALGMHAVASSTPAALQAACSGNAYACAFRATGIVERYASFC